MSLAAVINALEVASTMTWSDWKAQMTLSNRAFFAVVVAFSTLLILLSSLYVGWLSLFRAARRAKLVVRRVKREFTSTRHILDLSPEFVKEQEEGVLRKDPKACRVMSVSEYLASLDFNDDEVTAKKILVTLASAFGGGKFLPLIQLTPASTLLSGAAALSTATSRPAYMARFLVTEFPSLLVAAAAIDAFSQLSAVHDESDQDDLVPDAIRGIVPPDAMDLMVLGETPGVLPKLPPDLHTATQIVLGSAPGERLEDLVRNGMDLGPDPDRLHYATPTPFSPELAPGLCRGTGGLTPEFTPAQNARNRAMSVLMNRLGANYMAWTGYGHRRDQTPGGVEDVYAEFSVRVTLPGGGATVVRTPHAFLEALALHGGKHSCCVRSNITSFGMDMCVLNEDADPPEASYSCDPEVRYRYTAIPVAHCARTGITKPHNGAPICMLSSHSGIEWHFEDNELLGPGVVGFSYYTGIEGFTGFHSIGEPWRPWVRRADVKVHLARKEAIRAVELAALQSITTNICVRVWKFPLGGYGGLGVCADSVAVVETAVRGRTRIFPLMMRGDSKLALLSVTNLDVRARLKANKTAEADCAAALKNLDALVEALISLPNDIQVEPHNVEDALDRIHASSSPGSPFMGDVREREEIMSVKKGWEELMRPIMGAFEKHVNDPYWRLMANHRRFESWRIQLEDGEEKPEEELHPAHLHPVHLKTKHR